MMVLLTMTHTSRKAATSIYMVTYHTKNVFNSYRKLCIWLLTVFRVIVQYSLNFPQNWQSFFPVIWLQSNWIHNNLLERKLREEYHKRNLKPHIHLHDLTCCRCFKIKQKSASLVLPPKPLLDEPQRCKEQPGKENRLKIDLNLTLFYPRST